MTAGIYNPATQLYNWKPENTRAWRRGAARALSGGSGRINCFGPSTVAGYGANGVRSESTAWPAVLRRLLATRYGESGTGTIYFGESDGRLYAPDWKRDEPYGPYGVSCWSSATPSALFAFGPVRCSAFRVTYLTVPGAGKFSATILNSNRVPVVVDTAGANGVGTALVGTAGLGDWQLRINPVGGAPVFIIGVEGYHGGISVSNVGKGSTIVANLLNASDWTDSSLKASVDVNKADMSVVAFVENSPSAQTPEQMKADMRVLLNRVRASGSDVLLMTSIDWQGEQAVLNQVAPQALYDQAVYELAEEFDVPLFDVAARWGKWADSPGYFADIIHPTPTGYADIALGLYSALTTGIG